MNAEFKNILQELSENHEAYLRRTAEGQTYTRKFALTERLILLGAGHVAQATAKFASMLDWDVTVVDDRPAFANASRFPEAKEIICDQFVHAIQNKLHIHPRDYVCVLTRGHRWDADCLRAILPARAAGSLPSPQPYYLGMIGSRRRVSGLMDILKGEGFSQDALSRIHSPIGLRIKAETPSEIAISIVAEMIQERHSRAADEEVLTQTDTDFNMLSFISVAKCPCVMMLVLSTLGSAPALPGAMMLMTQDGRTFGTVGGGCSEGEAMSCAKRLMGTGASEVISVDLTNDVAEDEGMVCGGTMKILVEDLRCAN